jgi:hypothetical protein
VSVVMSWIGGTLRVNASRRGIAVAMLALAGQRAQGGGGRAHARKPVAEKNCDRGLGKTRHEIPRRLLDQLDDLQLLGGAKAGKRRAIGPGPKQLVGSLSGCTREDVRLTSVFDVPAQCRVSPGCGAPAAPGGIGECRDLMGAGALRNSVRDVFQGRSPYPANTSHTALAGGTGFHARPTPDLGEAASVHRSTKDVHRSCAPALPGYRMPPTRENAMQAGSPDRVDRRPAATLAGPLLAVFTVGGTRHRRPWCEAARRG